MKTIKYNNTVKLLHWLSALVILWATLTGLYTILPNTEDDIKFKIAQLNISITTIFIPIFCFRVYYRVARKAPSDCQLLSTVEIQMAHVMHTFLYVLIATVLLSGILMMDRPISIFNVFEFTQLLDNSTSISFFETLHKYSTQLLALCILLHIMALIKHEIKGNKILQRMI